MAKLINQLLTSVGSDKILHYLVAISIVSNVYILLYGLMPLFLVILLGVIITMGLELFKECKLDDYIDTKDIIWTFSGCITSVIIILISLLY